MCNHAIDCMYIMLLIDHACDHVRLQMLMVTWCVCAHTYMCTHLLFLKMWSLLETIIMSIQKSVLVFPISTVISYMNLGTDV